jgi:hypothetical protein
MSHSVRATVVALLLFPAAVAAAQVPGVVGLRDHDGLVIVWNRAQPYFRTRVPALLVSGYSGDRALFMVDGMILQLNSVDAKAFRRNAAFDVEATLRAHRDWEVKAMRKVLGARSTVESWPGQLTDGTPVLYWELTPEHQKPGTPTKHLMVTRFHDGNVICATSVEGGEITAAKAKALVFEAITHVEFSEKAIDLPRLQQELARAQ